MLKVSKLLKAASSGGGWFLPDGKFLEGRGPHAATANEYLRRGNWLPLGSDRNDPANAPIQDGEYDALFDNGWIRVWFDSQGICLQTSSKTWTTRNFQRVQEYVMGHPEVQGGKPEVYLEVGKTLHIDRETFLTANKPSDLSRDFSRVAKVLTSKYEPPYPIEYLQEHYPNLLQDPAHRWRAEKGIELIHREPSKSEQLRIWENWQQMSPAQKEQSDKQSLKLFGMTNQEHHRALQHA